REPASRDQGSRAGQEKGKHQIIPYVVGVPDESGHAVAVRQAHLVGKVPTERHFGPLKQHQNSVQHSRQRNEGNPAPYPGVVPFMVAENVQEKEEDDVYLHYGTETTI